MEAETALKEVRELRREGRHQEAVDRLTPLTLSHPTNADVWWLSGLSLHSLELHERAIQHLRQTVKLAPRYGPGWAQLGAVLADNGDEEATKVLLYALKVQPENTFAMRRIARLAHEAKDYEQELTYLLALDSTGEASGYDLNTLGICFRRLKRFGNAIESYHRSVALAPSPHPLYNLALIYNDPQISQDVDAVDVLRRALNIDPEFQQATTKLATITGRLKELTIASKREGNRILLKEEWFQFCLNPFELLETGEEIDLSQVDAKWIQGKKKRLLHGMELNDGEVEHLDGAIVDKSRVLAVVDELHNAELCKFHWHVFQCRPLLRFLTLGEIEHFLFSDDYFPIEMLEALDDENFRAWLSEMFAPQYNLILGRALEKRLFHLVESLFDGRRWTIPEHDDTCFAAAQRYIDRMLEPIEALVKKAESEKPNVEEITALLMALPLSITSATKASSLR